MRWKKSATALSASPEALPLSLGGAALSPLLLRLGRREQAAGGKDVLSAGGADGGEEAVGGEIVAQACHALGTDAVEGCVGDVVEAYQIDAAVQVFEKVEEGVGMAQRVVDAVEDDIFKREASLVRRRGVDGAAPAEVVLPQQSHHVADAEGALGGHQALPLLGEGDGAG